MAFASDTTRKKLALVAAIAGALVSLYAISSLVGRPARLVDLVGLFASACAAGAGLVVAIRRKS